MGSSPTSSIAHLAAHLQAVGSEDLIKPADPRGSLPNCCHKASQVVPGTLIHSGKIGHTRI